MAFGRPDLAIRLHITPLANRFPSTPADDAGELVSEVDAVSSTGWPVRLVERREPPASVLLARYTCFELGGAIVVRGPTELIEAHRDELVAALLAGRPAWDEVVCLADLLAGVL
jgi:hypothetical protein